MERRVVITGIGIVSPLGHNKELSWNNIIAGKSGINNITSFDTSLFASKVAGEVKNGTESFDISNFIDHKEQKKIDRFIAFAIASAEQAMQDSGLLSNHALYDYYDPERSGIIIGSGIGGLPVIETNSINLHENGPKRISPFFIPSSLINLAAGHLSIRYKIKGPSYSLVSACTSGAHAVGEAFRAIKHGYADMIISGGTEASICPIGVAGFASMRALSTRFNDNPIEASRPWDKNRDGFVIAEGSATLILEEFESAKKRNANIYGEIIGYGLSSDANHITSPCDDGDGAYRSMKNALHSASLLPDSIDYISAHATSTPAGDKSELIAIERIFNDNISVSSVKSAIGHTLGAAGAIEAALALLSIRDNILPPTLNLHDSEETKLDLIPLIAKEKKVNNILSNSFGFGGMNASLILSRI